MFFQDQSSTEAGLEAIFQGGANEGGTVKFEGVLYMPTWRVNISGNGSINALSKCYAAVADSFYYRGQRPALHPLDASAAGLPQLMPQIKNGPLLLNRPAPHEVPKRRLEADRKVRLHLSFVFAPTSPT